MTRDAAAGRVSALWARVRGWLAPPEPAMVRAMRQWRIDRQAWHDASPISRHVSDPAPGGHGRAVRLIWDDDDLHERHANMHAFDCGHAHRAADGVHEGS